MKQRVRPPKPIVNIALRKRFPSRLHLKRQQIAKIAQTVTIKQALGSNRVA